MCYILLEKENVLVGHLITFICVYMDSVCQVKKQPWKTIHFLFRYHILQLLSFIIIIILESINRFKLERTNNNREKQLKLNKKSEN